MVIDEGISTGQLHDKPDIRTHFPSSHTELYTDLTTMSSESDPYPSPFHLSSPSSLDRSYINTIVLYTLAAP